MDGWWARRKSAFAHPTNLRISNHEFAAILRDARRSALQEDLYTAQQLLNLAQSVETSRVVEPPAGVKTTARSSRTSLLVGAILGLLVGTVAALAAEPFVARRRNAASPEA